MKHWVLTILWRARNERWFLARTLARFCVAALAVGAFVAFAWRADPGPTRAEQPPKGAQAERTSLEPLAEVEQGEIGSLRGRDAILQIHATPQGPRYTLRTKTGELIGAQLFAEEVRYLAPGLAPSSLFASPQTLPILADTPEID